ncbi:hypothetical protein HDU86_005046 [Geranomyces michiganensis]|nr:hypothetical protein HDU86_005046 [Geranomyces michiganensis]
MSESHILSSSIHFAENFLRSEVSEDDDFGPMPDMPPESSSRRSSSGSSPARPTSGLEGIQVLTRLIDTILARVKVTAKNTFEDETPELGTSVEALPDIGGEKLKVIRFAGIKISLSELQRGDLPDPHLFQREGENPITLQYPYSAVLASTSTKKEDSIQLLVKSGSTNADRHRTAAAQLRVDINISSLCAIVLPEQLKVVFEILQRLGDGEALLARNRDFASRSESSLPLDNTGVLHGEGQQSWPSHGYPAAGEYVAETETTSDSHLRVQLDVAKMNIYLVTDWRHTSVDEGQFYSLFFGGQTAEERRSYTEDATSAAHVSTMYLTKVNTRLNTGTVSMDDILGEALSVDHVKIGLSEIVARVGYLTEVGVNQEQQSDLTVGMAEVLDWRTEPATDGRVLLMNFS